MGKNRTRLFIVKYVSAMLASVLLSACGGSSTEQSPKSEKGLPPPGMHAYKDPLTGKFVPRPLAKDSSRVQIQPESRQQLNQPDEIPRLPDEYESHAEDGGILLDLPQPYSEQQE